MLARIGKFFGPGFLLPMLLQEEGREVKAYLDMHRATPRGAPGGGEALTLAKESAEHATTLAGIAGKRGASQSHARYGAATGANNRQTRATRPATSKLVTAQFGHTSRKRPIVRRRESRRTSGSRERGTGVIPGRIVERIVMPWS